MATTKTFLSTGVALAALLVVLAAPAPAGASQLNVYELAHCNGNGGVVYCRGGCCNTNYNGSYRFYYNQGFPAFLYSTQGCSGAYRARLDGDVLDCAEGFSYKSIRVIDSSFSEEQLIKLPQAAAA